MQTGKFHKGITSIVFYEYGSCAVCFNAVICFLNFFVTVWVYPVILGVCYHQGSSVCYSGSRSSECHWKVLFLFCLYPNLSHFYHWFRSLLQYSSELLTQVLHNSHVNLSWLSICILVARRFFTWAPLALNHESNLKI